MTKTQFLACGYAISNTFNQWNRSRWILNSKLGTPLSSEIGLVVILNSKLATPLSSEIGLVVILNSKLGTPLSSEIGLDGS